MTSRPSPTAWTPFARAPRPSAFGPPSGGWPPRHARKASHELLTSAVRSARDAYLRPGGPHVGGAPFSVAAGPVPLPVNRAAQLAVGLGGGYCALWSYLWLRQGMQGAACAAWMHHQDVVPPRGPYAQVLLPAMLAAHVFGAAALWARSMEARPVSRTVAVVAVLTATCLLLAGVVDERPGAGVPLLLGTAASAAGARWGEARLPRAPRRAAPAPPVLPVRRERPSHAARSPTPEVVVWLAGEYEVL